MVVKTDNTNNSALSKQSIKKESSNETKKTDFEVIEACRNHSETGATFIKLFNGDYSDYSSKQDAFAELCGLLALQTDETEQTKRIAQSSSLFEISDSAPIEKKEALSFSSADEAGFAIRTLAKEFIESYNPVVSIGGMLYVYENGVYTSDELAEAKARVYIQDELAWNQHSVAISTSNANNVIKAIKDRVATNSSSINASPERLVVRNGILDVKTGTLYPHTYKEVHTVSIDVEYDPSVKITEQFKKYLDSTFEGVAWEIEVLQEIFGYCLYKGYFIEKYFFFNGDGNNGKSVCVNLLTRLLGKENITAMSLHDICSPKDQFSLISLYGKLANVCGETGDDKIKNMNNLKKATGRDLIRSRELQHGWVEFYNHAKNIFLVNNPPVIEDGSKGARRRLEILDFPNFFDGETADKQLETKLMTDESLTGVLNWAIEGLKRLFEKGEFSEKRTETKITTEYARKSNPIKAFVNDHVNEKVGKEITEAEMVQAYTWYKNKYSLPSLTNKKIKDGIIDECAEVGVTVFFRQHNLTKNNTERTRFFLNIEFENLDAIKPTEMSKRDDHKDKEEGNETIKKPVRKTKSRNTDSMKELNEFGEKAVVAPIANSRVVSDSAAAQALIDEGL